MLGWEDQSLVVTSGEDYAVEASPAHERLNVLQKRHTTSRMVLLIAQTQVPKVHRPFRVLLPALALVFPLEKMLQGRDRVRRIVNPSKRT